MTEPELQQLLLNPERQVQARSALRDVLDAAPRTLTYKQWLVRLPPLAPAQKRRRITLLSSFTLETLEPFLQVEAYTSAWRVQTTYVQLGRWQNALLEPAAAKGEQPAAVVLLLHDAELLGADFSTAPDEAVARLQSLLQTWRTGTAAPLFLGLVQAPPAARQAVQAAANSSQTPVTRIGVIEVEPGLRLVDGRGQRVESRFASFDHFAL